MTGARNRYQNVQAGGGSWFLSMQSPREGDREGTLKSRRDASDLRIDFAVGGDRRFDPDQKEVVTLPRFFGHRLLGQLRLLPRRNFDRGCHR